MIKLQNHGAFTPKDTLQQEGRFTSLPLQRVRPLYPEDLHQNKRRRTDTIEEAAGTSFISQRSGQSRPSEATSLKYRTTNIPQSHSVLNDLSFSTLPLKSSQHRGDPNIDVEQFPNLMLPKSSNCSTSKSSNAGFASNREYHNVEDMVRSKPGRPRRILLHEHEDPQVLEHRFASASPKRVSPAVPREVRQMTPVGSAEVKVVTETPTKKLGDTKSRPQKHDLHTSHAHLTPLSEQESPDPLLGHPTFHTKRKGQHSQQHNGVVNRQSHSHAPRTAASPTVASAASKDIALSPVCTINAFHAWMKRVFNI